MSEEKTLPPETKEENKHLAILTSSRGLVLKNMDDMWRFACAVRDSGCAPQSLNTPEKILIAIQSGAELGMRPMRSLNSFCVIKGAARLWGDTPLALVRQSGLMEYIKEAIEGEGDEMYAICETKRKGDPQPMITTFSVEDAKQANLWMNKDKPTWKLYPKRMLKYRARSFNLRDNFPDCFGGATIAEEYEGAELPTEAVTPDAGSRDARQAEGVKITDTLDAVKEQLEKCLEKFIGCAEFGLESKLEHVSGAVYNELFAKFAWLILNPDNAADAPDYSKVESYTLENLGVLMTSLESSGIPDSILALFPDPPMTEEEVTEHAKDILEEWKYHCKDCSDCFSKPKGTKKVPLCPTCLSKNIAENPPLEAKKQDERN